MAGTRRVGAWLILAATLGLLGLAWWLSSADEPTAPLAGEGAPVPPLDESAPLPPAPVSRAVALAPGDAGADAGTCFLEVVSAEDGRALAGAQVRVWKPAPRSFHHASRFRGFEAETDARGRVEVAPPEGGELMLRVWLEYFLPYFGPFVPNTQILLEPVPVLQGRVLSSARRPVDGALVTAIGLEEHHTRTAADGTFSLRLPRVDRLLAEKDGELAVTTWAEEDPVDLRRPVELVLAPPPQWQGRVVGRDGRPLDGVAVTAAVRAVRWLQTTGADGAFRVPRPKDVSVTLSFSKPGYVSVETNTSARLNDEVVLSRPALLEGLLVDQQGRPLPGVVVGLRPPHAIISMEDETTDLEGRFAFRDLEWPEVTLEASVEREGEAVDGEELREDDVETLLRVVLPEGETTRVTLALRPALVQVPVEVVSVAGVRVEDCEVTATPEPAAGWSSLTEGSEALGLRRGRFHFEVRCDDGRAASETRDVDPRPGLEPLRFTVRGDGTEEFDDEKPAEVVVVKAVTPTGAPVPGAEVECYTVRGETGPDGRFRCEVRAGDGIWPIHVHVTKGEERGLARATGKEAEVVVVLRSRVTLRGRVDGALPAGRLGLLVRSAAENGVEPLQGNTFAVEGRPAIRTFLCAVRLDEVGDEEHTLGCAVSEAGEEVVIPLGEPGRLTFSALDAAGAPLPRPIVYVDRVSQRVESPGGVVSLALAPGEHVLVLNVEGSRARYEARVTVRSGQETALGGVRLQ